MSTQCTIRVATLDDASALLEIYRPFVESTAASFELEPPSVAEFANRIERALSKWTWLVAECDSQVAGYSYASAHRERAAYALSVETSVYLAPDFRGKGVAKTLYDELFHFLKASGFHSAYAGVTLPNEASVRFHEKFGFQLIGTCPKVGYKFGEWHDVVWYYRSITE